MRPQSLYLVLITALLSKLTHASEETGDLTVEQLERNLAGEDHSKNPSATPLHADPEKQQSHPQTTSSIHSVHVVANSNEPIPLNAQHVVLDPNRPLVISVQHSSNSLTGSSLHYQETGSNVISGHNSAQLVIPQNIFPLNTPIPPSSDDLHLIDQIEKQIGFEGINLNERNNLIGKYIEFVKKLKGSKFHHEKIRLPRLVFVSDNDKVKYEVIEGLIGVEGALTPEGNVLELVPRFPIPLRFVLKNDPSATETTFEIDGHGGFFLRNKSDIFKVLHDNEIIKKAIKDNLMGEKTVEVRISGPKIASLVLIDLPLKAPASNDKTSINAATMSRLFHKYLLQPWGMTVAIGQGSQPFEQWDSLKLIRTFDDHFRRTFVVTDEPPMNDDGLKLNGLVLGLQESLPTLKQKRMFFVKKDNILTGLPVCKLVQCGNESFVEGLQIRLLQTWSVLKSEIKHFLQEGSDRLTAKIDGYEGYLKLASSDEKWKALMGQVNSALQDPILFFNEDKIDSSCGDSPLDRVKTPLFEGITLPEAIKVDWIEIFKHYQQDISQVPIIPEQVNWSLIRSALTDLRNAVPNRNLFAQLKSVLTLQMKSLNLPKNQLFESIKTQWINSVSNALDRKPVLSSFPYFVNVVKKALTLFLENHMNKIEEIDREVSNSDGGMNWLNGEFKNMKSSNDLWMLLMKTSCDEGAIEGYKIAITNGFTDIKNRHSVLTPRIVIVNLLTKKIVHEIIEKINQIKSHDNQNHNLIDHLTNMSPESLNHIKELEGQVKILQELTQTLLVTTTTTTHK